MQRQRKLLIAKISVVMATIPILIWAHEYGPDAGYCGVPRENGNCTAVSCHVGTANNSNNKGSVTVAFPNGLTYTPGVAQHLKVTIADPDQRAWGFQLTARLASNTATMAGSFQSSDKNTLLMCASASLFQEQDIAFSPSRPQTCPNGLTQQYMEHSLDGYNTTRGQSNSATYEIDWTPPASDVGNIQIYLAGNAANGDLTVNGDHIYVPTPYVLTPIQLGPPSIQSSGVVSASDFGGFPNAAPGSWVEIKGANLSATTRLWGGGDFAGVNAPTSLDGVKVTIDGQAAFVYYISPTQINAQAPSNVKTGPVQLTVTVGSQTSPAYSLTIDPLEPGLLAPSSFNIGGKQYVVAQFPDGSYVLPPGAVAGINSRQAKPGETVVIYGVGFGPAATSSNATIPAGQIVTAANQLTNPMQMQIGGAAATLSYFGLAPNFVGLYQFNVTVPSIANSDTAALTFTLNGKSGPQTLVIAVKQ